MDCKKLAEDYRRSATRLEQRIALLKQEWQQRAILWVTEPADRIALLQSEYDQLIHVAWYLENYHTTGEVQ